MDSLVGFRTEKAEPTVPSGLLKAARKSGQLNLSGRGLTEGKCHRLAVIQDVTEEVYVVVRDSPGVRIYVNTND